MKNSDIFIEKYKMLEKAAIEKYGFESDGRAIYNLERMGKFRPVRNNLAYCRDVRNLLMHNPKIDGEDAVQPSDKVIAFLDKVLNMVNSSESCMRYAIKMESLYYRSREDNVYSAMERMNRNHYSHVPILEKGRVAGVFSKSAIFSIIMRGKSVEDLKKLRFSDIMDYTAIDYKGSETYVFIDKNVLVETAEDICEDYYRHRKRIGMFFITDNGTDSGRLLGAITPWEILGTK